MKKTLLDRYEELVPGTIDRLNKSDEEKAKSIERFFKIKPLNVKVILKLCMGYR